MRILQVLASAPRGASASCRTATAGRRAAAFFAAIGIVVGTAVMTAGPALAGVGSEPGHLKFSPAGGDTTLTPTWSTTDGCPTNYQGSAQIAVFNVSGTLLSSISNVAYNVQGPFSGQLDGSISAILRFAHVPNGGSLEFAVGCYSMIGAAGTFTWIQSTLVTLSSDGKSYSTSAPSGQWATSASNTAQGPLAGPNSGSDHNLGVPASQASGGLGAPAIGALIAGACALAAGASGFVWYRRRNRSRLM